MSVERKPPPSPPVPADFGISEEDIAFFESRKRRIDSAAPKLCLVLSAVVVGALGGSNIDWNWLVGAGPLSASTYANVLAILVAGGFLTLIGALPAAAVVFPIASFILSRTTKADSVRRYLRAASEFRDWLARTRRDWWIRLSGHRFEVELARLFRAVGWEARVTRASGDGGVDIEGSRSGVKYIAQCKNHRLLVGPAVVRELYGTLLASDAHRGILASVSGFTKGVREFAKGKPIELIDLDWIMWEHMQHDASWRSLVRPSERRLPKFRIGLPRKL